jgi:branched-chain amino acid transport system ATP-binding protein
MNPHVVLHTVELSVKFGGLNALQDVKIQVREGELFGLIGPNGAGKTTFFNVVTGFLKPTSGSVMFKGEPITGLKSYEIAKRGIARTFQITSIFSDLTCEDNVVLGSYLKVKGNMLGAITRSRSYREGQAKLREKARAILVFVELEEKKNVIAENLSFGDQRKLEIAIALSTEPELILLDEPAAGMNPEESNRMIGLIQSLQKRGLTVIIVEHNMRVVMRLCSQIAVFNSGQKIAEGTPDEIMNNEEVISVYLGDKRW